MSFYGRYPGIGGGGGGGGGSGVGASGSVNISNGASSVSVTYTTPGSYNPVWSIQNTSDTSPIFLQGTITAESSNGFTVTFSAPTDSANYYLNYSASVNT